jgi:hypothetical protein
MNLVKGHYESRIWTTRLNKRIFVLEKKTKFSSFLDANWTGSLDRTASENGSRQKFATHKFQVKTSWKVKKKTPIQK